jgi:predicted CxxxxCH...CXXCH cytochrome family protein
VNSVPIPCKAAVAAILGAIVVAGCSSDRIPSEAACVTWESGVGPRLSGCTECHRGAQPAGSYDLTSYLGALGGGTDVTADAIAGDATSRLLTRLDPATADAPHRVSSETLAVLRRWIVDCELAALDTPLHARGVLDPASAEFHGATVAALGWDLKTCAKCHGEDFSGGTSGATCNSCHSGGPTDCDTCHSLDSARAPRGAQGGARPYGVGLLSGAHRGHSRVGLACTECHRVPQAWDAADHVRNAAGADVAPAELVFGAGARRGGATPQYVEGRCSNVYCHGSTLTDGGAAVTQPTWTGGAGQAACGSCHGAPPSTHADNRCTVCHPTLATTHLDGKIDVGNAAGCVGCHGNATSPAPPRDLSGATVTTALGVGAHRAHLEALHRLRGPIACSECHQVPATIGAVGHLDSASPAEVTASLGWDRTTQTCNSGRCHGPSRPRWTSNGEVACGTCHGIPPATAAHAPNLPLSSCTTCHPRSVDSFGNILFTTGPGGELTSEHINGIVDLP